MVNTEKRTENCLLFVYGTLMQGFFNPFAKKLHQQAVWKGRASVSGELFDLGYYPGAVYSAQSNDRIWGEVWQLEDFPKTIAALDRYEGIHDSNPEYTRREVPVVLETGESVQCRMYVFCQPIDSFRKIPHGDYRRWLSETKQQLP
ncbi:MAG: gamma-glutamylcyclotransferase family protein [Spirosomataceae bacterium]